MKILQELYGIIWGAPALLLILSVGLYYSALTGFGQLRLFPKAVRCFIQRMVGKSGAEEGISSFQALCTALAATVGTGNLAGVAGAIAIGGPGSVFWMWICGILGMIIKCAEATLAVRYRFKNSKGEYVGGPMYMIAHALPRGFRALAVLYAFFGVVAAFGVGNATQIHTVLSCLDNTMLSFGYAMPYWGKLILGILLAALIGAVLLGGARRIGNIAELLVPFAAGVYLLLGATVLLLRYEAIPAAFHMIIIGAFQPGAVTGGVIGSLWIGLRTGVSRGVFTNEAGMGTASIAHASAAVAHPVEQGLMGIMEVFLDTIVICTLTALVILCSGIEIPYGVDTGIQLTGDAFSVILGPWVGIVITACLCLFALATVLGWGLYGIRCAQFLFGDGVWKTFALLQVGTVIIGALLRTEVIWLLAELINGLMAIPNLIALWALSPEFMRLYKNYTRRNL